MKTLTNMIAIGGAVLALAGCGDGTLRMDTRECPGVYIEQVGGIFKENKYNLVTTSNSKITSNRNVRFELRDYSNSVVDWNNLDALDNLSKDSIDEMIITEVSAISRKPISTEAITPGDSNSRTLSGMRARDLLITGNNAYLEVRKCFVEWAIRDFKKKNNYGGKK